MLRGYEIKWQGQMREATRREFTAAYPNAEVATITRDNYQDFLELPTGPQPLGNP
jgi:hypothetical protein